MIESAEEFIHLTPLEPYYNSPYAHDGIYKFEQKKQIAIMIKKVGRISLILLLPIWLILIFLSQPYWSSYVEFSNLEFDIGNEWPTYFVYAIMFGSVALVWKIMSLISDWYIRAKIMQMLLENAKKKEANKK